ncbi:UNVERIFIED_CONTAM: hypothetical protein K2H54_000740 [Gekko kuhli]
MWSASSHQEAKRCNTQPENAKGAQPTHAVTTDPAKTKQAFTSATSHYCPTLIPEEFQRQMDVLHAIRSILMHRGHPNGGNPEGHYTKAWT